MTRVGISAAVALVAALSFAAPVLAADVGGGESIVVSPPVGRVGQHFDFECKDFPQPKQTDSLYVVPAGTADVDPLGYPAPKEKILWKDYASNCYPGGRFIFPAGPFAPGNYEVRFATSLYNNDGRVEISTRTPFSVH